MKWFKRKRKTNKKEQDNNRKNINLIVLRLESIENNMYVYKEYELYMYVNKDIITDELIKYIEKYSELKEYIITGDDECINVFKHNGKHQSKPLEFG